MSSVRPYRYVLLLFVGLWQLVVTGQSANFRSNVVDGCAPLTVNFSNLSTGSNLSYEWDFGNGNKSNQQNPGAIYIVDGTYTVKLKIWNASGSDSITKSAYINVYAKPQAKFGYVSPPSGCAPTQMSFRDSSIKGTHAIQSWLYDFGDGSVSSTKNPNHTYQNGGTYSVSLQVTDIKGCTHAINRSSYIKISDPFQVDYSVTKGVSCAAPLTSSFTSSITGGASPYTYAWDFGDGGSSNTTNPSHTFTGSKAYTVKLTVTDINNCSSSISKVAVNTSGPKANYIIDKTTGCAPLSVHFKDQSSPPAPISTIKWTVGNHTSSNRDTIITFTQPGNYTVTWMTYGPGCGDTLKHTDKIRVYPSPIISFTASDTMLCNSTAPVNLYGFGADIQSWKWSFGNGDSSNKQNSTTTYYDTGKTYTISLIATNVYGCATSLTKANWIQKRTTRVHVKGHTSRGCLPYWANFTADAFTLSPVTEWKWSFGNGDSAFTRNVHYSYPDTGKFAVELEIKDSMGCTATSNVTMRVGMKPRALFTADTFTGCSRGLVVNFINHSRDSSPIYIDDFDWDFGHPSAGGNKKAENPIAQYHVPPNKYDVKLIVRNNGCEDSLIIPQMIDVKGPFISNDSYSDPCQFNTFWDLNRAIGGHTWYWDYLDGHRDDNLDSVGHIFTQLPWHVNYFVHDSITGCWDSTNYQGGHILPYGAWPNHTPAICAPATISFRSILFNIDSVLYEFSNGFKTSDTSFNTVFKDPGVYWRKLTLYNKQGCSPELFDSFNVVLGGPTAKAAIVQDSFCLPGSFKLVDLSGVQANIKSKKWSIRSYGTFDINSDTMEFPILTPLPFQQDGVVITLTIEDDSGCIARDDLFAHPFKPAPSISVTQEPECNQAKYRFKVHNVGKAGLEPITYKWEFPGGSTVNPEYLGTLPPNQWSAVYLTATDPFGCQFKDTFNVNGKGSKIKADIAANPAFSSCPPLLVNFSDSSLPGPDPLISWEWDFGDSTGSLLQNPKKNYLVPGKFTISLKVADSKGCVSQFTAPDLVLINGPSGTYNFTPNEACESVTVAFTSTSIGATKIEWDLGDGNLGYGQALNHYYDRPGRYIPLLILSNDQGCKYTLPPQDTIFVRESPGASFSTNEACVGTAQELISMSYSNEGKIISQQWYWKGSLIGTGDSIHPIFKQPGFEQVELRVTSSYGCVDTALQEVPIPGISVRVTAPDTLACLGQDIIYTCSVIRFLDSVATYKWEMGDGTNFTNDTNEVFYRYPRTGPFTAKLIALSYKGCIDSATAPVVLVGDTIPPLAPNMHRVSIGTDMGYQAEFAPSKYIDFYQYHIELTEVGGSFEEVANRYKRLDTLFIHPSLNTLHQSYQFKVLEENACGAITDSFSSEIHASIEVQASGDTNAVDLNWNAYQGWEPVYYVIEKEKDIQMGTFDSIGVVVRDSLHYRDTMVTCYSTPNYRIRAVKANDFNIRSYSDTTKFKPPFRPEIPFQDLLRISVEDDRDILADWYEPLYAKFPITGYLIEYSKDGYDFSPAGDWTGSIERTQTKKDLKVDDQSYYFRMRMRDSCGDIGPPGPESRSILLKTSIDTLERPSLTWSSYLGWSSGHSLPLSVHHYLVERLEPNGQFIPLAERAPSDTFFIDDITEDVSRPHYCYRITALSFNGSYNELRQVWSHSNVSCAPVKSRIFVANAFTPNGDQLNEGFQVKGMYIYEYQIQIYNRWGQLLYTSDQFNEAWDGTYDEQPCQEDVYIYLIDALGTDGEVYHLKGNITLLP